MALETTITIAGALTVFKEWFWAPLLVLVSSAFGRHIKWQHEEKKATERKLEVLHKRITMECVDKGEMAKVEASLKVIEDDVKWLTRNRPDP